MLWLWVSLIILGAGVICALLFVYEKRKQIFRKRTKEEKQAKKQAKLNKKTKIVAPAVPEEKKPIEEINLSENLVEVIPEDTMLEEEYSPSSEFIEEEIFPTKINNRNSFKRDMSAYNRFRNQYNYSNSGKQSVKEQIKNLSPEMKVLLLTGALDRKDEDEF